MIDETHIAAATALLSIVCAWSVARRSAKRLRLARIESIRITRELEIANHRYADLLKLTETFARAGNYCD